MGEGRHWNQLVTLCRGRRLQAQLFPLFHQLASPSPGVLTCKTGIMEHLPHYSSDS